MPNQMRNRIRLSKVYANLVPKGRFRPGKVACPPVTFIDLVPGHCSDRAFAI